MTLSRMVLDTECCYAECKIQALYAKCRYAECRGTAQLSLVFLISCGLKIEEDGHNSFKSRENIANISNTPFLVFIDVHLIQF